MAGCNVALPRLSRITEGFSFDCGAGPTVFQGINVVEDTSSFFGIGAEVSTNIGPWAYVRGGYGFTEWLGLDLSCASYYGPDIAGKYPPTGLLLQPALTAKVRPWGTNHLLLLEYRGADFGLGWVFGLPTDDLERFTGSLAAYKLIAATGTGWNGLDDYLPNEFAASFAWTFYLSPCPYQSPARLSPNIGGTFGVGWQGVPKVYPYGLQLGITYQP
jgi:hypothetical protein